MPVRLKFLETGISMAATFRSIPFAADGVRTIGWQIRTTTADGVGAWSVQYSNDYDPSRDDATSDAKWDTYTLTTTPPNSASADQTFGIIVDDFEFAWARVKYTRTSGTGTAIIDPMGKGE